MTEKKPDKPAARWPDTTTTVRRTEILPRRVSKKLARVCKTLPAARDRCDAAWAFNLQDLEESLDQEIAHLDQAEAEKATENLPVEAIEAVLKKRKAAEAK